MIPDGSEILGSNGLPADQQGENLLTLQAHPVTRVYCSQFGIIMYERYDAEPIAVGSGGPKSSRLAALRRCYALLEPFWGNENDPARDFPISNTGRGLTYNQLREQTFHACNKSKEVQKKREEEFAAKKAKYGLE